MEDFLTLDDLESGGHTGWLTRPRGGLAWRQGATVVPGARQETGAGRQHGPWLVFASGIDVERYAVLKKRQLLTDFDRLAASPSQDRVRQFADQYGWLDRPQRLLLEPPGDGGTFSVWGEAYGFWRGELDVWRTTRELWRAARSNDHKMLRQQIRWTAETLCWTPYGDEGPRWPIAENRVRTAFERRALFSDFKPNDPVGPARWIVLQTVNKKLYDRVGMLLVPFRFTLRSFPKTLLGALYLRFAIELAGGSRERLCDECGLPFAQGRVDNRYCGRECLNRTNYRARKDKERSVSSPVSNDASSTPV
jgi:hypothetical protein